MMHHNFELASIFEEYIVHIPSQKHIFYERHFWSIVGSWNLYGSLVFHVERLQSVVYIYIPGVRWWWVIWTNHLRCHISSWIEEVCSNSILYDISLVLPLQPKTFGKAIPFSQCCLFQLNNLIVLKITLNNDFVSTICRLLYDMWWR